MSLELIQGSGTHPCRFQGVCTVCGWHWPKGGYVQLRSVESLFGDHDCHPSAHVGATCNEPDGGPHYELQPDNPNYESYVGPVGMWICEDCAWPWPIGGEPPAGVECDNCGGPLVRDEL